MVETAVAAALSAVALVSGGKASLGRRVPGNAAALGVSAVSIGLLCGLQGAGWAGSVLALLYGGGVPAVVLVLAAGTGTPRGRGGGVGRGRFWMGIVAALTMWGGIGALVWRAVGEGFSPTVEAGGARGTSGGVLMLVLSVLVVLCAACVMVLSRRSGAAVREPFSSGE